MEDVMEKLRREDQERIIENLIKQEVLTMDQIVQGTKVSKEQVLKVRNRLLFERYASDLTKICDLLEKVRLEGEKRGEARMTEKYVIHMMEVNPDMELPEACKIIGIKPEEYFDAANLLARH